MSVQSVILQAYALNRLDVLERTTNNEKMHKHVSIVYIYIHADTYIDGSVCVSVHPGYLYAYVRVYECVFVYAYLYVCIYIYTYLYVYVYIFVYLSVYVYVYAYVYVHIHVYVHDTPLIAT